MRKGEKEQSRQQKKDLFGGFSNFFSPILLIYDPRCYLVGAKQLSSSASSSALISPLKKKDHAFNSGSVGTSSTKKFQLGSLGNLSSLLFSISIFFNFCSIYEMKLNHPSISTSQTLTATTSSQDALQFLFNFQFLFSYCCSSNFCCCGEGACT
jgi:hypothetical protein